MSFVLLEIAALAIVVNYVRSRWRQEAGVALGARLLATALAAWVCEETCIRWYDFYHYAPGWSLFVGSVPVMVLVIWPVVIHSAGALARALSGTAVAAVALGGLIVLIDAALIEPVSVQAGLWHWTQPGLFTVPPIGIIGWALFATACLAVFAWNDARGRGPVADFLAIPIAFAAVHPALLALWWGALRWVNASVPDAAAAGAAWAVSLALCVVILRRSAGRALAPQALFVRVPAALFFFVLVGLYGRSHPALVAFFLAFTPPYLLLTWQSVAKRHAPQRHRERRERRKAGQSAG